MSSILRGVQMHQRSPGRPSKCDTSSDHEANGPDLPSFRQLLPSVGPSEVKKHPPGSGRTPLPDGASAGGPYILLHPDRQVRLTEGLASNVPPLEEEYAQLGYRNHHELCHKMAVRDAVRIAQTLGLTGTVDPHEADPTLTRFYLSAFFEFINVPAFEVLPRHRFMNWVTTSSKKSPTDKTMLYALMAWTTAHCTNQDASEHRTVFKTIVYRALDRLEPRRCLQVAHVLLFLAHAEYADQRSQAGSDVFMRFINMMALLELGPKQDGREEGVIVYDFPPAARAECHRRTLWAAFCSDIYFRLGSSEPRNLPVYPIPAELPCATPDYDVCRVSPGSCFEFDDESETSRFTRDCRTASSMAHLVQITQICGDVYSYALLTENDSTYEDRTESARRLRDELEGRLRCWAEAYNCSCSTEAITQTDQRGERGGWTTPATPMMKSGALDMLYHHAHMGLNRRIRHRGLSRKEIHTHARYATLHALQTLRLAQHLLSHRGSATKDYVFVMKGSFTIPALCEAIEIISAVGKVTDILEPGSQIMSLMYSALDLLEHLGRWWGSDYSRYAQVKGRVQTIFRSAQTALQAGQSFFYCSHAAVRVVASDCDIVYGTDREEYLRLAYVAHHHIGNADIFKIDTST